MEYPLSIWWRGMFCPLQGYPFDRVFSSQIAHGVPKAVRGVYGCYFSSAEGTHRLTGLNRGGSTVSCVGSWNTGVFFVSASQILSGGFTIFHFFSLSTPGLTPLFGRWAVDGSSRLMVPLARQCRRMRKEPTKILACRRSYSSLERVLGLEIMIDDPL